MSKEQNTKRLPKRSELDVEHTWRLEDIFQTDEEWEKEYNALKKEIPKLAEFKGKCSRSSQDLLACLKLRDALFQRIGKLYTYSHLRHDQDTANSLYQALQDRAMSLSVEASSLTAYIVPEILSLNDRQIQAFLEENEELKLYRHTFETLSEKRPHILSESEEELIAQAADVMKSPSAIFGVLNNADLTFPSITDEEGDEIEVTHGRYIRFLESSNRRVRKDAFKAVYETYGAFKNTFATTLSSVVKKNNFQARVRKYSSARHAALGGNHIPEEVYDQLIQTVTDHLDLLHRYTALRKRVLHLEELHMYDLYTPLVQNVEMNISYPEAQEILLKALKPLGDEYINILKEAYQNRWVDVFENKGKRSGAYSSGSYGTNPYILMNWQDNVNNLFTLAHEFGHSLHSYYTRKTQPYEYGDYTIFVAEVASTCNEALLNDYLLRTTSEKQKQLYLLNHYLESFRGTVFRQTLFAEFEHMIHQEAQKGKALTSDLFSSLYYDLNKKYYGEAVVLDPEIKLEWARIPHFYYNYYVYQYATGFSAATALAKQILEEGKPAVERYLTFLKSGSSDYSINLLKKAGVDMTSPKPIEQALQVFKDRLDELEKLLG